jgi:hypothetical protein
MMEPICAENLRQQLTTHRKNYRFHPYPPPIRQQAIQYAQLRKSQGATFRTIAVELGVAVTTAAAWAFPDLAATSDSSLLPCHSELSLVPLVIQPDPQHAGSSTIEVRFADGTTLQASGFGDNGLARAIEVLRKAR